MSCGRPQIGVRLRDSTTMRLPRAWTDGDGDPPQHIAAGIFTAAALLDLGDALRARH
jgi:hypothetical protein